eukprot:TRINITY_DN3945_c0_g1_i3.p1 TRINITY_DN3945_c0_g1~~TRINITY_DN3945_c0_g1_i3.p1  ORF type:complete len:186 (+),score=40.88 TRINITY_DN3945_c0_g1_i3:249-806(+)
MALPLPSCAHPTNSSRPLHFQPTLIRALVGSNARNPRWVFNKFQNLQRNCGKGGALSAKSCIKSVGDEGFREKKDGSVGDGDGLIIVDHGSRRQESNLMLNEFVAMFRDRTGYPIVEPAHMDIPSLAAEAAKDHPGVSYIVTAPLGLHELLVDVVNERLKYCLRHAVGDAEECMVCAGTGKCRLC